MNFMDKAGISAVYLASACLWIVLICLALTGAGLVPEKWLTLTNVVFKAAVGIGAASVLFIGFLWKS